MLFADWFRSELLKPRIDTLRARAEHAETWARTAKARGIASGLVAFVWSSASEALRRAEDLDHAIGSRLDGDDHDRAHSGWIARAHAASFFHKELRQRVRRLDSSIETYASEKNTDVGTEPGSALAPA